MTEPFISIIIPVRNEADLLKNCLESISKLDYPADRREVIIADGLSTDRTTEVARSYGAEVVTNRKQTVSPGRNIAFGLAKGELVAFTDADCIVDSKWLRNAVKYFEIANIACAGGPNLTPPEEGNFGKAVGFVFGQRIFAAGSIHARTLNDVREVKSIPGCNAIYRKDALEKVMPIDETLLTCDDTELNQRLLDKGFKLLYTPDVFVWHYRRPNPKRLWKQMYRYAIGRLQAGKRDKRMINSVHIFVGLSVPFLLLALLLSPLLFIILTVVYLIFLFLLFIYAFFKERSFPIACIVPFVTTIILFSWSMGFVKELILPFRRS